MARTLIFDFDGTLANSLAVVIETYNEVARARGFKLLKSEDYQELRSGGLPQVLKWAGIKKYQVPAVLKHGREVFRRKQSEVELFSGTVSTLKKLSANGNELYILSTNSQEAVQDILARNGIADLANILPASSLQGKDKAIKKLIKNKKLSVQDVWMIGDEARDIEAAHKAGVNSCGVTWGFQPRSTLKLSSPTELVDSFKELERFFS
jgi:phosphoglycolate phosphatase